MKRINHLSIIRMIVLGVIFLVMGYTLRGQCTDKTFHLPETMVQEELTKLNYNHVEGIILKSSAQNLTSNWSVYVEARSAEKFTWVGTNLGTIDDQNTNDQIIFYKTRVDQGNFNGSSTLYNSNGDTDSPSHVGGLLYGHYSRDDANSNSEVFLDRQLYLYDDLYHDKHNLNWNKIRKRNIPIDVKIILRGAITTADIEAIKIPGVPIIGSDRLSGNHYPVSEGLDGETINIQSVSFALQKDVAAGTYESVWGNWMPGTSIPPLSTMPQRPFRVELKAFESGQGTIGGYNHHGAAEMIGPIYAKNNTESAQDYQINATIEVNNPNGEVLSYAIWIDYEQNALSDCQNFLGSAELVASGEITQNIQNVKFELKDNVFFGFGAGDSLTSRLRLSVKKGAVPPSSSEIFAEGEVEDFVIQFNSSICATGAEIPYDYAIYAEEEVPYCGVGGYKYTKDIIEWDYRTDPSTGLFEIGEVKDIPYALSKFGKTAYRSEADFITSLAQLNRPNLEYEVVDPQSGELVLNPDLDPLQNPAYRKLMWTTTYTEETDPSALADQILYQDIYYPVPEYDRLMTELRELPLIVLMAGGGFMWQCRNYAKTRRIARWFARRGYVVAVIDYRQGTYFEKDIAPRAIIRAWQDSRTAVKWWHSSGFDQYKDDSNNPLWKVDLDRIYGAGGSAGAITMMHNAALTPELLDVAINSGELQGIGAGYVPPIDRLDDQWESAAQYASANPTYDLRDYESIPCLPTIFDGITTCDLVNTSTEINPATGKPKWGEPAVGLPSNQRIELESRLMNFAGQPARVEKVVSLAGALSNANLLTQSDDWRPILDIHHGDDGVVPAGTDYFFSRFSGQSWLDNLIWYTQAGLLFEQLKGGKTLKQSVQGTSRENRFKYREIEGPEKSSGWPHYHQVAFRWGGATYGEYVSAYDDYNPEATDIHTLEPKLMLLADAFMTGIGGSGGSEPIPQVPVLSYPDEPVLHLEDNTTDLAPLLGISTNTGRGGYTTTTTTKASGLASFQLLTGGSRITLDENNRFIHQAFTERTVSFWVKPTQSTGIQDLYDEGGNTQGFGVRLNNGVVEIAARNNGVQADLVSSQVLPTNLWTHVTAVFDVGRLKLYINGAEDELATVDAVMFTQVGSHGNAAGFGATEGNSNAFSQVNNNFVGWLDNLKVYNVTPSDETSSLIGLPDNLSDTAPKETVAELLVYPNPTSGATKLYFALQESGTVNVRIMNLAGQQVYSQSFGWLDQGSQTLEIQNLNLPASAYVLEVAGSLDRWVKRLIIRE